MKIYYLKTEFDTGVILLSVIDKNLTYDQICHEHIAYYDLSSINKIFKQNNLKILDLGFHDINGGSIEISCSKNNHFINLILL